MARYEREPEVIDDIVTALAKFLLHNFNSIRQEVVSDQIRMPLGKLSTGWRCEFEFDLIFRSLTFWNL